jgi:hypothetical protein
MARVAPAQKRKKIMARLVDGPDIAGTVLTLYGKRYPGRAESS